MVVNTMWRHSWKIKEGLICYTYSLYYPQTLLVGVNSQTADEVVNVKALRLNDSEYVSLLNIKVSISTAHKYNFPSQGDKY